MDQAGEDIVNFEASVGNTAIFVSDLGAPVEGIEFEVNDARGVAVQLDVGQSVEGIEDVLGIIAVRPGQTGSVAVLIELVGDVLAVRSPLLKQAAGGIMEELIVTTGRVIHIQWSVDL